MVLMLTGCSTEKAKWTNVTYHNTTCHYNVWWNGNESLKAGRKKLKANAPDDYTLFLPVEQLGTPDAARSINPEMDRAVEKGVKGIRKHSITVGGEEHVPYIKECYLLTAYATFYKQDYTSTINTCNILVTQFRGTRAGDEAAVLLARCMTQEKRYSEAEATLDQLVQMLGKENFSESQKEKLYLAMVEATVPQEKYKKAVEYIHLALQTTHSRQTKARLNFLLAQIYQKLDRRSVASKYYRQVLDYGPEYVMEFNARLGEASCADLEHSDVQRIEKQLDKMLSDRKNEEYRDQIYYAKGEMYLGVKDAQKACDNLKKSVAAATANRSQKAKSALRLGEVLYDVYEDYDQAQRYYDTAMQCITPEYPDYSAIKRRSDMLTELCTYTRAFQRADSLLAVAALPEEERNALIKAKIDTLKAQEERAREQALLDEINNAVRAQQNTLKGDWYFYNQNTVQKGREAFTKNWGARVLEDNWFLSNKPDFSLFAMNDGTDESDTVAGLPDSTSGRQGGDANAASGNPNDPHSVAYYLKELPTTQQQIDSLDTLIATNLLSAGYIYYDGIHNEPRALECYHRLANEYTGYDEVVQTFYMLYRIYDRQGNTPQANYYRDMVLMGFPDSDFANLIRDNEYYKELLRREHVVENAYEEMFDYYQRRRYNTVVTLCTQAEELYAGHPMIPKFRYFKGLALAHLGQKEEAIASLQRIVQLVDRGDTIFALAQTQLDYMKMDSTTRETIKERRETARTQREIVEKQREEMEAFMAQQTSNELPPEAQVFRYRENQQYYVLVLVNDRRIRATELQYKLTDFNTTYYSNANYRVNATLFNDTMQMLTIHRFADENAAMGYYRHLQQQESPLRLYSDSDHTEFFISTQNYATFYNRKDINAYMAYFKKFHLKE